MGDEDSDKIVTSYKPLLLLTALAAVFVIGGMVYVMQMERDVSRTHRDLTSVSEHIIGDMAISHLWLEEILSGDADESVEKVFERLEYVDSDLKTLSSAEHTHLFLLHPEMDALSTFHEEARTIFDHYLLATDQRLAQRGISGVGTPSDQRYDELFERFLYQIDEINDLLHSSQEKHLNHLESTQTLLILISLSIMLLLGWFVKKNLRQQQQSFEKQVIAEKSQHEVEAKHSSLIEQSPFSIQVFSPDGETLHVNRAWEDLWGLTVDDIYTKGYNILNDPQLVEKGVMSYIEKGFAGESMVIPAINYNPAENREVRGPHSDRWVRAFIYPLKDHDGSVQQVVLMYEDVTERHLQEIFQLGQNEILEMISDPSISLKDTLNSLVLFIEKLSPEMIGSILLMDESEEHVLDGAGPSLPDAYRQAIDGVAIGPEIGSCGTAAFIGERVVVSDIDTDPLWREFKGLALAYDLRACWSQPIKDSEGRVLGTFAMYYKKIHAPDEHDLNLIENAAGLAGNAIVHKYSMEAVISSEALMAEAQRLAHIGSWELNPANGRLVCSDEIYRIFEIDPDSFEASYELFLETVHPDDRDRVNRAYARTLKTKQPHEISHRLLMEDGRIKHVNERCESFFDHEGRALRFTGSVQDITERVEAQQQKEGLRTKMEHVQRLESLGVLAGGIAHDFNNILTTIMGNAGLAEGKLARSSPAFGYLDKIVTASHRAADLCKQMLAYSGKGKFVVKAVDLSELVAEMSRLLDVSISKNVVLKEHLAENLPAVEADAGQLQQVVMNLITNANEAIEERSGIISLATGLVTADRKYLKQIEAGADISEGRYVYLEVSDTGCGMDEETQKKIFDPFFTTKFTGRGLGMSAILGIVRGHKGAIKCYSELGKGTTFKVLFPAINRPVERVTNGRVVSSGWRGVGLVLIVDDEETICQTASIMLQEMGFETDVAANGIEGLEKLKEHGDAVVAVLMDMTMPEMDGVTCFSEMRKIRPEIKVMLSSGYNEQDATSRFAGKGLAGFIQKPYTPDQLADKMKALFT